MGYGTCDQTDVGNRIMGIDEIIECIKKSKNKMFNDCLQWNKNLSKCMDTSVFELHRMHNVTIFNLHGVDKLIKEIKKLEGIKCKDCVCWYKDTNECEQKWILQDIKSYD